MTPSFAPVVKVTCVLGSKIFITDLLVKAFFDASKALFCFYVHMNSTFLYVFQQMIQ